MKTNGCRARQGETKWKPAAHQPPTLRRSPRGGEGSERLYKGCWLTASVSIEPERPVKRVWVWAVLHEEGGLRHGRCRTLSAAQRAAERAVDEDTGGER